MYKHSADGKQYRAKYKGAMTFVVGEDDPEPTGYTMSIQTSSVEIMDWTTWQTTVYPDVTKYTITVHDANGKQLALFDVINGNDKGADQLAGTYTIVSDAHDPMQISGGYSLPDYGMAGGTSYLDDAGKMQYGRIQSGTKRRSGRRLRSDGGEHQQDEGGRRRLHGDVCVGGHPRTAGAVRFQGILQDDSQRLRQGGFHGRLSLRSDAVQVIQRIHLQHGAGLAGAVQARAPCHQYPDQDRCAHRGGDGQAPQLVQ